jgi:hypothetical protein
VATGYGGCLVAAGNGDDVMAARGGSWERRLRMGWQLGTAGEDSGYVVAAGQGGWQGRLQLGGWGSRLWGGNWVWGLAGGCIRLEVKAACVLCSTTLHDRRSPKHGQHASFGRWGW